MSKKNLLFICGNIGASSSQGVRYRNLLPYLATTYATTLLSFNRFFTHPDVNNITLFPETNVDSRSDKQRKSILGNIIIKTYKAFFRQFIFPDRYKFYLRHYREAITKILQKEKYQVVIIAMTPYSLYVLPEFINKQKFIGRIIVDLSDPFSYNVSNHYSFIFSKRFIYNFEKKYLKYVNHLVVLNPVIKSFYNITYGIPQKISVIEQGLDEVIFENSILNNDKNEKPVLVYGGGLYHKFREPFELYNAVNKSTDEVCLKIYGNIVEALQPPESNKIKYLGQISQTRLTEEYFNADILVFIDNVSGMQVPGKILELLAIAKPILFIYSNDESPTIHYSSKSEFVVMVKNKKDEILRGIEYILSTDFSNVQKPDLSQFYWGKLSHKYTNIING